VTSLQRKSYFVYSTELSLFNQDNPGICGCVCPIFAWI